MIILPKPWLSVFSVGSGRSYICMANYSAKYPTLSDKTAVLVGVTEPAVQQLRMI